MTKKNQFLLFDITIVTINILILRMTGPSHGPKYWELSNKSQNIGEAAKTAYVLYERSLST